MQYADTCRLPANVLEQAGAGEAPTQTGRLPLNCIEDVNSAMMVRLLFCRLAMLTPLVYRLPILIIITVHSNKITDMTLREIMSSTIVKPCWLFFVMLAYRNFPVISFSNFWELSESNLSPDITVTVTTNLFFTSAADVLG